MPWADGVAGPADQAHRLCRRIAIDERGPHPSGPELRDRRRTCRRARRRGRSLFRQRTRQRRRTSRLRLLRRPPRRSRPQPATPASVDRHRRRSGAVGRTRRRCRHQAAARRPHGLAQLPAFHRAHRHDERPRRPQSARDRLGARRRPRPRTRAGGDGAVRTRRRHAAGRDPGGRVRRRHRQLRSWVAHRRAVLGGRQHQPQRHGAVAGYSSSRCGIASATPTRPCLPPPPRPNSSCRFPKRKPTGRCSIPSRDPSAPGRSPPSSRMPSAGSPTRWSHMLPAPTRKRGASTIATPPFAARQPAAMPATLSPDVSQTSPIGRAHRTSSFRGGNV